MNTKTHATALILLLSLGGCSLAPKYEPPEPVVTEGWGGTQLTNASDGQIAANNLGWREFFIDPRLQKLIATALAHNHDLKTAALNVELAQAQYGITKSDRLPSVGLNGSATRSSTGGHISESYSVGLGVNSFELDFFGRVKNLSKAALNSYLATKEARDTAQLSLIKTVAKTYYQWQTARDLRDLAQKTLTARQQSYDLTQLRFQEGVSSGTDLSTANSAIALAQAAYQAQQRSFQQAQNALSVLVGQPLANLDLPQGKKLTEQFSDNMLFIGTPSEVLLNRPDIRQAEYALKSANANIGVARASLFPSITLTGSVGYASAELNDLVKQSNRLWSVGPSINLPIFDMGKRKAGVKISHINQKIALEQYQKSVKTAFQEVSDALIAKETLTKQYEVQKFGQTATAQTLKLVKQQVDEGLVNGLTLLDAERADFSTRQNTLTTLMQLTNNQVDLYLALGGGLLEQTQSDQTNAITP